jgi:putative hydrolase of HD superfamily
MKNQEILDILSFIRKTEKLKNTLRSAHTSEGRQESVAEHTWRLALMAIVFANCFPGINMERLLKICIIHDLGEALNGDIPAPEQAAAGSKDAKEKEDYLALIALLPAASRHEFRELWDEYAAAITPEAKLAKALDKLETIMQHNQGHNPDDFDYGFNLEYGQEYTNFHPVIEQIRHVLDLETREYIKQSTRKE